MKTKFIKLNLSVLVFMVILTSPLISFGSEADNTTYHFVTVYTPVQDHDLLKIINLKEEAYTKNLPKWFVQKYPPSSYCFVVDVKTNVTPKGSVIVAHTSLREYVLIDNKRYINEDFAKDSLVSWSSSPFEITNKEKNFYPVVGESVEAVMNDLLKKSETMN